MDKSVENLSEELESMDETFVGLAEGEEEVMEEACCKPEEVICEIRDNKIRDIEISQLNYGYIVKIGCHKFAIEKPQTLVDKLLEYFKNPSETEDKWFKGELLK